MMMVIMMVAVPLCSKIGINNSDNDIINDDDNISI